MSKIYFAVRIKDGLVMASSPDLATMVAWMDLGCVVLKCDAAGVTSLKDRLSLTAKDGASACDCAECGSHSVKVVFGDKWECDDCTTKMVMSQAGTLIYDD